MKTIITINTDNAAFDHFPGIETGRILQVLAKKAKRGELWAGPIIDINGQTTGSITTEAEQGEVM